MKKDIHPQYNKKAKIQCACGQTFEIGSSLAEINVEICSACHPFYTGKEKMIDTAGRVEKFQRRMAKKTELNSENKKEKKVKKTVKTASKKSK